MRVRRRTAGGCLASQYLVGWVIEKKAGAEWKQSVLKSIQPVGEGLCFSDAPEGGMFLWVELPPRLNTAQLLPVAIEAKVAFVPGAPFKLRYR